MTTASNWYVGGIQGDVMSSTSRAVYSNRWIIRLRLSACCPELLATGKSNEIYEPGKEQRE